MLLGGDEKSMLSDSPIDPDNPRNVSDVNWLKAERTGGRKERRIELGMERMWERY